jgi:hypothetical protein
MLRKLGELAPEEPIYPIPPEAGLSAQQIAWNAAERRLAIVRLTGLVATS